MLNDLCIITRSIFYGEYNLSPVKNNLINYAQLHWSDESEPYSPVFNDIFFNNNQGLKESQYVFFEGNQLNQRWLSHHQNLFCIAETGFGSGLNFFNSALQFLQFREQNPDHPLRRLQFISFERYPFTIADIKKSLQQYPQFADLIESVSQQYPLAIIGCHRLNILDGLITLDLWFGDINEQLPQLGKNKQMFVDAWYLDGFNPSSNPDMWQQHLFELMFDYSKDSAKLATFTAAGFVRRALIAAGFTVSKRKGFAKKREMLVAKVDKRQISKQQGNHQQTAPEHPASVKDIAIIGGGIASLCSAIALAKRGNKVTLYCQEALLGQGASGNLQGTLYPLLNQQHDELSQLFANAFLFARHYYQALANDFPFAYQFTGLLQLAYDQSAFTKLDKIKKAGLPEQLVNWIDQANCDQLAGVDINQQALFYPLAGWLSPRQLILSLQQKIKQLGNIKLCTSTKIESFKKNHDQWSLTANDLSTGSSKEFSHHTLVLTTAMNTLEFKQCRAVPLSAARGQVTHINSDENINELKVPLCHEGYLTPAIDGQHCMGATFKRHDLNTEYRQDEQLDNLQKLKKCLNKSSWSEHIKITEQAHVGIRCTTRDHFPYLGKLPDYDTLKSLYAQKQLNKVQLQTQIPYLTNVYLFTGLGSRGLCSAPLLAELLACEINQESKPISDAIYNKMQVSRQWISYINKDKPLKE